MKTIQDVLAAKGNKVFNISPESFVLRAVERMVENKIGCLVVMDNDRVKGVITERDYLCKIVLKSRRSADTKVKEIMSDRVIFVTPDESIKAAMEIMTNERVRHLPVIEDKKLVGLISIGDVMLQLVESQGSKIKILQDYISDGYPG